METDKEDAIQKRVQKVLENRFHGNKETLEALEDLSTFFKENTLKSRRNLRSQIEKRSLSLNEDLLDAFTELKTAIDGICDDISDMSTKVHSMQDSLEATKADTHDLIEKTNQLQEESHKLTAQHEIASAFLDRFQLTAEESARIHKKNEPITDEFFTTLERVQQIHGDCRVLLQSGYQTAALDIMEEMTNLQEVGLEKLYRWTQAQCRTLDDVSNSPLVMQAMNRLQERPVLFKYVIDEYSTGRRAVLVRNFIDALTTGSKPIEMHAHDPKRYIGDIFAWLHQAIPNEKENLLQLVKLCEKIDSTDLVVAALANISDGVVHPLRVRVETILNSGKDIILLYSIANLIRFYQNIINHVVKGGALEQTLLELRGISEASYLNCITHQVKAELSTRQVEISRDLLPPPSVGRLLSSLKEILSVASMVEERQNDIAKIVGCYVDPLLQYVTETAAHLTTTDMAVYFLNCLSEMMTALAMFEYMDQRMERLQGQCDAQIDTLTSEQASSLVANLNLGSIYTVLQSNSSKIEINHLKLFMTKFEQFLEMPEILLLPQVNLLISSNHRSTIQKRSFNVILAIYKQLYERVMDPANGFNNPQSLFSKTPEEVSELLAL